MSRRPRVYLAGPDVFFPDAEAIGCRKKAICADAGLEGLFPLDHDIDLTAGPPRAVAQAIFLANRTLMQRADGCLFNLTPFRGPGADPGTVWELGYLHGLDKPVIGYTQAPDLLADRVRTALDLGRPEPGGVLTDRDGLVVEQFDCVDNLMIDGAIEASGGALLRAERSSAPGEIDFDLFAAAVSALAERLARTIHRL
ncbi:MAG: nucleoside 2-deoxyribosyltransferase [Alphaproteobacteria bacterium]